MDTFEADHRNFIIVLHSSSELGKTPSSLWVKSKLFFVSKNCARMFSSHMVANILIATIINGGRMMKFIMSGFPLLSYVKFRTP